MHTIKLGSSELYVSPWAFGGNVLGWTVNESNAFEILDAFISSGFNFIDTADCYSRWAEGNRGGESETIIGNWFHRRQNRHKVILATKVGSDMGQGHVDISKKYIIQEVEQSLLRLRTDYIDLYQTHWDNLETPVEETLEAYQELIKAGKVRFIGASNFSSERLIASLEASARSGLPRYQTFQPCYNLYDRQDYEEKLRPVCEKYGLSTISYYSLASGFLTGKYTSVKDLSKNKARGAKVETYLNPRGEKILSALRTVADKYSLSQACIALAWLCAQPTVAAPIASVTSVDQLTDIRRAFSIELDSEDLALLSNASSWQ